MEEALISFNNVHIIVHNVMNGLLPIIPEPKLHEMVICKKKKKKKKKKKEKLNDRFYH